jgi:hypothetical protein
LLQLNKFKIDLNFVTVQKKEIKELLTGLTEFYLQVQESKKMNNSASFDFVNYAGVKSVLEDFKGKYVYIVV